MTPVHDDAPTLPDEVDADVRALAAEGDALAEAGDFRGAVARYDAAFQRLPEPRHDWEAATWLMAAIGDACFLGGWATSARKALEYAMHCPGGLGNPFLHLRLGQVCLDQGEPERAADELARAWMGAGPEIFAGQDPKYLAFLGTRMRLVPPGPG